MPYEYGPYRKKVSYEIKLNYNCPTEQKDGSGPGSCKGASGTKKVRI